MSWEVLGNFINLSLQLSKSLDMSINILSSFIVISRDCIWKSILLLFFQTCKHINDLLGQLVKNVSNFLNVTVAFSAKLFSFSFQLVTCLTISLQFLHFFNSLVKVITNCLLSIVLLFSFFILLLDFVSKISNLLWSEVIWFCKSIITDFLEFVSDCRKFTNLFFKISYCCSNNFSII